MGWQDRDYNRGGGGGFGGGFRGGPGGGGLRSGLLWLLWGSIPIGRYFAINVRVHITFILFAVFQLFFYGDPVWTMRWMSLLFISVLLHEFGHCFACRHVGGRADDILMWPLGGLASVSPPKRPWPEFVTVAGGPLVSLILALVPFVILFIWFGTQTPVGLNPFEMWRGGWHGGTAGVLRDLYLVNYTLLLFNLALVFYPFDGGRIVQTALWAKFGYLRSMKWSMAIGMAGAGAVALFGLLNGMIWITLIAAFGFYTCYQQNQLIAQGMISENDELDPGYYRAMQSQQKRGLFAKLRDQSEARKRKAEADEQAEVDRILDKVKAEGLASLTHREKKTLQRATERGRGG